MNPEEFTGPEEEPKTAAELELPESGEGTQAQPGPPPDDEEQHFIRIDTRKWAEEMTRLEREDPRYKEIFHARIGQRAQRKYGPELQSWQQRYNDLQRSIQQEKIRAIPPADLGPQLAANPALAAQYAEAMRPANPLELAQQNFWGRINRSLTEAIENGLPDERAAELAKEVEEGKYGDVSVDEFFQEFGKNILGAVVEARLGSGSSNSANPPSTPTPTQASALQPPAVNPNLLSGAPTNGQASRGNKGWTISQTEYQELLQRSDKFVERFPADDDWDKAISAGMIEGLGPHAS